MKRTTWQFAAIVALTFALSCSDSDLSPSKKKEDTLPPPAARSVFVTAQMQNTAASTADVYYYKPSTGLNYYVGTVSGTSCQSFTTITENDGETLYFFVLDGSSLISFRARAGVCATSTDPIYCGGDDVDPMYEVVINGSNVSVGIRVIVGAMHGDFVYCAV